MTLLAPTRRRIQGISASHLVRSRYARETTLHALQIANQIIKLLPNPIHYTGANPKLGKISGNSWQLAALVVAGASLFRNMVAALDCLGLCCSTRTRAGMNSGYRFPVIGGTTFSSAAGNISFPRKGSTFRTNSRRDRIGTATAIRLEAITTMNEKVVYGTLC
jgi:hypothetical protein